MLKKGSFLFLTITSMLLLFTSSIFSLQLESRMIQMEIYNQCQEVEAIIKSGEVLVPTRSITQALGAKLDWVPSLSTLKITFNGEDYLLRVDDQRIQVGDIVKELNVPVLLDDGRTYLSLACIAPLFGFRLVENGENYRLERPSHQLKEIRYDEGEIVFSFRGNPEVQFIEEYTRDRVMVEIFDVERAEDFQLQGFTNTIPIERVRVHHPEVDRIVVTFFFNQWQEYFIETLPFDGEEMVFQMIPGGTITQFGYDEERNRFSLVVRGEIREYSSMVLTDPYRMVIDIPTARLEDTEEEEHIFDRHPTIDRVLMRAQEKDIVRIVFYMEEFLDFDFTLSPDGRYLVLTGEKRDLLIREIAYLEIEGRPQVVITGTQTMRPEIFYLSNPHRLVVDFPYSALNLEKTTIEVGSFPVSSIRASQFSSDISRVVIDLEEYVEYLVKTDPLHPEKTVIAFPSGDFHVFLHETPAATRVVIDAPYELDFEMLTLEEPYRLVVDLKDALLNFSPDAIPLGNGMVNRVDLDHISSNPVTTRLVFHLPYYVGHNPLTQGRTRRMEIDLFKSDLRGRVIFIDPGHGGADPGAIGITGTFEKDVVLDISLRLESLLKQAGAQVIMSRRQDVFVDLYERVDHANRSPAEIFISIHANSVAHDFPMGTETYVSNNSSPQSLSLAHIVQQEMLSFLNLHNRGVKKRDFYVVKATRMPSILVEVAFLSNEREERLLKDPSFRQRSAEAIFSGIKKYFQIR